MSQPNLFESPATQLPPPSGFYAQVVFDRPLDQAYSYAIPEDLHARLRVGKRVRAPFGRGNKPAIGYCIAVTEETPSRAVKMINSVLDDEPLVTPELLRLTRWIADYYVCGWGQVLNAVIPAGVRDHAGTRSVAWIEAIPEFDRPSPLPRLSPKQEAAWQKLLDIGQAVEMKRLARLVASGPGPVEALVAKNLARRVEKRVSRFVLTVEAEETTEPSVTLNSDQLRTWSGIEQTLREGGFKTFLLYGVTGSGKTEIYLKAIEEVIRQGKQAIVLVPEISLTPQTIQRFRGRCGDVAVLHSHLSDSERSDQWRRVAQGLVPVVVGARSAIFAPTRHLGLIVVDEEHESTFKQDNTPRYHGRDVAIVRAQQAGVPIILGSATPSLESWHNAQRGQYTLLTLPKRVLDRPLPRVVRIDMRREPLGRGRFHTLSQTLEKAMRSALENGGQAMLLLNRRGFNTYVHCLACGHVEQCRFCDLAMTFHRQRHVMLCHYCGYEQPPLVRCPKCGEGPYRYHGQGTEKLQEEIETKFPHQKVGRMDSDSMRKPGSHARVLRSFKEGEIRILLGTQMIAKGLDFPNVTLVGVVEADIGLYVPDFRSAERTFQLLSQVAGRTGRGPRGGLVLVQSFNPDHPCIAMAAEHDFEGFAREELNHRREHHYPPFERLARLVVRSRDRAAASKFAESLAERFSKALELIAQEKQGRPIRLLGPAEAPIFKLKGFCRYNFQIHSSSSAALHRLLQAVLPTVNVPAKVDFQIDIDPFTTL